MIELMKDETMAMNTASASAWKPSPPLGSSQPSTALPPSTTVASASAPASEQTTISTAVAFRSLSESLPSNGSSKAPKVGTKTTQSNIDSAIFSLMTEYFL